jgi:hypothetical protein
MEGPARDDETPAERANRELIELLNELRVVLPGVTVLFAFLLAVPFAKGWPKVTPFERDVFIVAILAAGVAIVFLTAPSSFHRLRFGHGGNKEQIVTTGNAMAIAGIAAFAVALEAVILLVGSYVLSRSAGITAAAVVGTLVLSLWYGLPLAVAMRDRRTR